MTATELANYGTALPNLSMPIAASGDKRTPIEGSNNSSDTQASVKFGLPSLMSEPLDEDGVPVPRQDLNGLYNMLSKVTHYLMAGGRIPWMQAEATAIGGYPNGAEVTYNGHNYKSLADSNTALPTDTTKWACIDYLPLTGGTMSGTIFKNGIFAVAPVDNNELTIAGGADGAGGAIFMRGSAYPNYGQAGSFVLRAATPQSVKHLIGLPDGTLTWTQSTGAVRNIVRAVDDNFADTNGNVALSQFSSINFYDYFTSITGAPRGFNWQHLVRIGNVGIFSFKILTNSALVQIAAPENKWIAYACATDVGSGTFSFGCDYWSHGVNVYTGNAGDLTVSVLIIMTL